MNRIVKFRAWHFGLNRMFTAEEMTKDQLALLPDGHFANISSENTRLSRIYSHDEMLPLQFTGLTDKNGVEIYENDLIETLDNSGNVEGYKVVFHDGTFQVEQVNASEDYVPQIEYLWNICRASWVIGNIYEHPQLLK